MLFLTRTLRLFGYGLISIVLVLYLVELGLSEWEIGSLLALTLLGDTVIALWLSVRADRAGRQRMLLAGALSMAAAGTVFLFTRAYWLLLLAATVGVISPSGHEVGPFLSIEQAALSHVVPSRLRTPVFAWYHLVGTMASALGALAGGGTAGLLQRAGWAPLDSFRAVIGVYAGLGVALTVLFLQLTPAIEAGPAAPAVRRTVFMGLHRSRPVVFRLSSLFALDAFGGGFVVQSIAVYWFHARFGVSSSMLGAVFFGANVLSGISALAAVPIARRIGLIPTMVFTHIPSNVLLMLVPAMPTLGSAVAVFLLRFSISQMDVPTRQSYVMAVVDPDERSAAAGVTGVARTAGSALSPALSGMMLAVPGLIAAPFVFAGALKITYDLLLWRGFRSVRLSDEGLRAECQAPRWLDRANR
ncbi:MAG: MFS transporter [Acidobacteria bacterium]|nr:MAG: MFS transporter [Acidobacteriota bacterium]